MLNIKIIKKDTFNILEARAINAEKSASAAEGKVFGLENDKTRLEKTISDLTLKNEQLQDLLKKEEEKHRKALNRMTSDEIERKKKWLHGYPNETYGGGQK